MMFYLLAGSLGLWTFETSLGTGRNEFFVLLIFPWGSKRKHGSIQNNLHPVVDAQYHSSGALAQANSRGSRQISHPVSISVPSSSTWPARKPTSAWPNWNGEPRKKYCGVDYAEISFNKEPNNNTPDAARHIEPSRSKVVSVVRRLV
ncbi:hypothetical protein B0J12DRAFT_158474 [Macrophomina phaseolina]|uniref:Uncharacterized protein n=1 Tax=Macrophomina phaseolina TaxID=35725 RepID=A0ABQ8GRL1_9PEZI|nr:hypothetical protein B0J12DRAFT_158474 [Macrophomina phaseolina]